MKGIISFGVIVAFIMYVRYFTQPLGQIGTRCYKVYNQQLQLVIVYLNS